MATGRTEHQTSSSGGDACSTPACARVPARSSRGSCTARPQRQAQLRHDGLPAATLVERQGRSVPRLRREERGRRCRVRRQKLVVEPDAEAAAPSLRRDVQLRELDVSGTEPPLPLHRRHRRADGVVPPLPRPTAVAVGEPDDAARGVDASDEREGVTARVARQDLADALVVHPRPHRRDLVPPRGTSSGARRTSSVEEGLETNRDPGGNCGDARARGAHPGRTPRATSCRGGSSGRPSPPKSTPRCATRPGSLTEWIGTSPPMSAAVAFAVPDGASRFVSACSSTISRREVPSRLAGEAHHQDGADREVRRVEDGDPGLARPRVGDIEVPAGRADDRRDAAVDRPPGRS